jgi:hypothetical protein
MRQATDETPSREVSLVREKERCEFRLRYVWYQTDSRRKIDEAVTTGCFVAFREFLYPARRHAPLGGIGLWRVRASCQKKAPPKRG